MSYQNLLTAVEDGITTITINRPDKLNALNSLAGHYTNYPNRPVPDALRDHVSKELKKAETGVVRGA